MRNGLFQNEPEMFNWIKVMQLCRPIRYHYLIGMKPILHNLDGYVLDLDPGEI